MRACDIRFEKAKEFLIACCLGERIVLMIKDFNGKTPLLRRDVFVAENAAVIGDVQLAEEVSVWYGAVLRGDTDSIRIGRQSNVQDNATIHVGEKYPVNIGSMVTVGHNAVVHGCTVGDNVLIGIGAVILNGACIESDVIVAAGALVPEGQRVKNRSLVMGIPARVVRELTPEEISAVRKNADAYHLLAAQEIKNNLP